MGFGQDGGVGESCPAFLKGEKMVLAVRIIGIVVLAMGIMFFIQPAVLRRLLGFFKKDGRMYFIALVRFALAVVFLMSAQECRIRWLIVTFGILFIASGLIIFMLGARRMRGMLEWVQKQSALLYRVMAAVAMIIGGVIIYGA